MLLTKLEMHGFKSFADRTAFDFRPGITAFVGPNGCGKSNIVDAVRWILGEKSAHAIRGTNMQDVIFNGTATRRSLGYAEASLTFLNNDGKLGTDYTEVCVTRRLYRSGESEYLLNKQPCRLRDILQLFMDTGVGAHAYSIIEQGKVARFIQANAKERRALLEEAAGISRYKAQRHEAQARLERTRLNLQKVEVQLDEQRKQLRSIKYQAAKARRYRSHTARLRELVLSFSLKNYKDWEGERKALEKQIAELDGRYAAMADELATLEAIVRQTDAEIKQLDDTKGRTRDELHRVESRIDSAEAGISHNRSLIREYEEETERSTRTIWTVNERLRQAHEERAAAERDLEAIRLTIQRQSEGIAEASEKAAAAGEECERLAGEIEDWKNRMIRIIEQATTLRNELNHMDAGRRQQLARRSRLAAQLAEKKKRAGGIDEEIEHLTRRRDAVSGRLADRSSRQHETGHELRRLEQELQSVESRLRELRRREARYLSRREILQDLETRAEGVETGVKRLLRNDGSLPRLRIQGMVADLVRADLRYAPAIEAALGDAAQYVVTVTEDEAGAAASLLRTDRSGRAGLIPLRRARGPELSDLHLASEPGVVGRACDVVRYSPELEPVVRHLLGNAWIVRDLATALHLSGNGGVDFRFITLEGERVEPSGAIVGGEPLPRAGIVSRKSELADTENQLRELARSTTRLEAERGGTGERAESLRGEVAAIRKDIEQGNLEKLSNENEILNLRRRQKALAEESALVQEEVREIVETIQGYDERQNEIQQELAETDRGRSQLRAEMEAAQKSLADQQAAADRLREEITGLKVALAEKQTLRGGLEQNIRSAGKAAKDLEDQIAATRARMDELRAKQLGAQEQIAQAKKDLENLAAQRQTLDADLLGLNEARERATARREEATARAASIRGEQDALRQRLEELRLQEQEHRVRMEGLSERVFSEHGVRLEEQAASQAEPEERDWDAVQREIDELREKIRRMGGVNEDAIDEETGLDITISQTEAQRDDLVTAEHHLREVIRKLNRVSRERFMKTFEEVRANFKTTFRRLFGGGRADLVLDEDEPDVLEAAVEVLACPPEKELRSISLLSGGEKTMTTIALLFAIFQSNPSPFCILDEVDAALDESNIGRFTDMLAEFVKDSQFLLITHSKRTISTANVLYGITMQEKGVSKKVSVRIEDGPQSVN